MDKNEIDNKIIENKNFQDVPILNDDECSMIQTKFDGDYPYLLNTVSTRYIIILDGKCKIDIGGNISVLKEGDTAIIPPNTKYKFSGTFETILIDTPKFLESNEVIFID